MASAICCASLRAHTVNIEHHWLLASNSCCLGRWHPWQDKSESAEWWLADGKPLPRQLRPRPQQSQYHLCSVYRIHHCSVVEHIDDVSLCIFIFLYATSLTYVRRASPFLGLIRSTIAATKTGTSTDTSTDGTPTDSAQVVPTGTKSGALAAYSVNSGPFVLFSFLVYLLT